MTLFLLAGASGLVLLAALIGWGALAIRFVGVEEDHWADAGVIGLAVAIAVGGVICLTGLMSPTMGRIFIAVGVALAGVAFLRRKQAMFGAAQNWGQACRADWLCAVLTVVCMVVVTSRYLGSIAPVHFNPGMAGWNGWRFNPHDDAYCYLVMPERFIQTGRIGPDPFNSGMMLNSLGGGCFLQALVLSIQRLDFLNVMERGVCLILLFGQALSLGRRLGLTPRATLAAALCLFIPDDHNINLSSYVSGAAVLLFLIGYSITAGERKECNWRDGLILGLVAAAGIGLKMTTAMPISLLMGLVLVRLCLSKRNQASITLGAAFVAVVALTLTPWMMVMYMNFGTMLYPFLGAGHQVNRPDMIFVKSPWREVLAAAGPFARVPVVILIGLGGTVLWRRALPWRVMVGFSMLVAWLLSLVMMSYATAGLMWNFQRYIYPIEVSGTVAGVGLWFSDWGETKVVAGRTHRWIPWAALTVHVFTSFSSIAWNSMVVYMDVCGGIIRPLLFADGSQESVQQAQKSIPPGEKVLVRTTMPFFFDFRRNPVYVADWPGKTSPTPGLPLFSGPDAIADYLRSQGIRYVIYSYSDQADYPKEVFTNSAGLGEVYDNVRKTTLNFQDSIEKLGKSRRIIYDDGHMFVLDINTLSRSAAGR